MVYAMLQYIFAKQRPKFFFAGHFFSDKYSNNQNFCVDLHRLSISYQEIWNLGGDHDAHKQPWEERA